MHRYRSVTRCLLAGGLALSAAACSVPTPRENVEATAQLVRSQVRGNLEWRRDPEADNQARTRVAALLEDGVTLDEAVAISVLASPTLQIALEQLAISRAELVAAVTPPNPVAIMGSRKPGGDLAAFYPERSVSIGVLQNVIALLNSPDRRAVARHDLQRSRYETAQKTVEHAAQVVQSWLEHSAALQIHALNEQSLQAARAAFDAAAGLPADDADAQVQKAAAQGERSRAMDESIRSALTVETTRARLGELMGVSGWRDDWQLAGKLPPVPEADPDSSVMESAALQQRFDLQADAKVVDSRLRSLATQRRFRWLNQLEVGVFRDKALGGSAFTGPNAVVEIPLFDQRRAVLMQADAELRAAMRRLEEARLAVRTEIRVHLAELKAIRQQLQQFEDEILAPSREAGVRPADEAAYLAILREYWRTRSALALAAGNWSGISGL